MEHLGGNSYYFNARTAFGGYKIGHRLILIDSGNDDSSVKKAIRPFGDIHIAAIINTHSHADHCGGNAYIQKQFASDIYAPELEKAFIENPILEPTYLFGASPLEALKNKFLYVKPSRVTHTLVEEGSFQIKMGDNTIDMFALALPGHSPNQMGYITPDGIAYLGDALVSEDITQKHPLIFTFDVKNHLESLEKLRTVKAKGYVIAHGGYFDEIEPLITANQEVLLSTQKEILNCLQQRECTLDDVHEHLAQLYHLEENISQAYLNRSVIMAHVKYLIETSKLELFIQRGKILLQKI